MSTLAIPLNEFDEEMTSTRRVLERVPDGQGEWKPHKKSFALAHLAQLVSDIPRWIERPLRSTELGVDDFAGYSVQPTSALISAFDRNVRDARAALEAMADGDLEVEWSLKSGDHVLYTATRREAARGHQNHLIHHRGQLTVYLRLLEVPLPAIYGPSADEKW